MRRHRVLLVLVASITFIIFFCHLELVTSSPFQWRDLSRALDILEGNFIWHGPETSDAAKLPGPLYYFLLALPLAIFKGWKSAWLFMIVLNAASAALFFEFLRRAGGYVAAFLGWYLLIANQVLSSNIDSFWNPSFLPVFLVAALWFYNDAFSKSKTKKPTVLFFLIVALACQIHFSVFLWIPAFIFTKVLTSKKSTVSQPTWIEIALGLSVVIGIWGSFFILSSMQGISFFPTIPPGSHPPTTDSIHLVKQIGMTARVLLTMYDKWLTALVLGLLAGAVGMSAVSSSFRARLRPLLIFLVPLFIFMTPIWRIAGEAVPMRNRYLLHLVLMIVLFSALIAQAFAEHFKIELRFPRFRKFAIYAGPVLVFTASLFESQNLKNFGEILKASNPLTFSELEFSLGEIARLTGWTHEQARHRIFFINVNAAFVPQMIYDQARVKVPKESQTKPESWAGFFVARTYAHQTPIFDQDSFMRWLARRDIAPRIRKALKLGEIVVGPVLTRGSATVVPYWVRPGTDLPHLIHNSGEFDFDRKAQSTRSSAAFFSATNLEFRDRFENCMIGYSACESDVVFSIDSFDRPAKLNVSLSGELTSQPKFIAMYASAGFRELYVTVKCGDAVEQKFSLADRIGYNNEGNSNTRGNSSFLTPTSWTVPISCKRPIDNVRFGWSNFIRTSNGFSRHFGEGVRIYR